MSLDRLLLAIQAKVLGPIDGLLGSEHKVAHGGGMQVLGAAASHSRETGSSSLLLAPPFLSVLGLLISLAILLVELIMIVFVGALLTLLVVLIGFSLLWILTMAMITALPVAILGRHARHMTAMVFAMTAMHHHLAGARGAEVDASLGVTLVTFTRWKLISRRISPKAVAVAGGDSGECVVVALGTLSAERLRFSSG